MQNLRAQGFVYDLKPVIQGFLLVDEMLKGLSIEMEGDIKIWYSLIGLPLSDERPIVNIFFLLKGQCTICI